MNRYKSSLTIGIAITVAVSGCAQTGETKSKQYAIQGCIAGGLVAGVVTFAANLGDDDAKKKALVAGVLGCMAGAVVGHQVGKRTEEYVDAQHAASSEIARNKEQTEELRQYNAQVEKNIEDYKDKIDMIKNSSSSEEEQMEELKKTHEIVTNQRIKATDSLKTVEADISEAKKLFNTHKAEATPQDKKKWQAEIAVYEKEKEILSEHVNVLNALDSSI